MRPSARGPVTKWWQAWVSWLFRSGFLRVYNLGSIFRKIPPNLFSFINSSETENERKNASFFLFFPWMSKLIVWICELLVVETTEYPEAQQSLAGFLTTQRTQFCVGSNMPRPRGLMTSILSGGDSLSHSHFKSRGEYVVSSVLWDGKRSFLWVSKKSRFPWRKEERRVRGKHSDAYFFLSPGDVWMEGFVWNYCSWP